MNITAIGACDDFHMASIRWDEPKGGVDEMVKIRLLGTTNEIKRMRRVIERNRSLEVWLQTQGRRRSSDPLQLFKLCAYFTG